MLASQASKYFMAKVIKNSIDRPFRKSTDIIWFLGPLVEHISKVLCLIRRNSHISKVNVKIKFKFMTQTDSGWKGQQNFTDLSNGIIISNSWTANKKSASHGGHGCVSFALSLVHALVCV